MRYAAFLRAINLGSRNKVPMPLLRDLFEDCGFTGVKTYIHTGNVAFSTPERDAGKVQRQIEKKLAKSFGFSIGVFVLTKAELVAAAKKNPLEPEKHDHKQHTHLVFLSGASSKPKLAELVAKSGDQYRFALKGAVLYYAYSGEVVGNRRPVPIEKVLGVTATARTWKVVNKMIELLDEE